MEPRELVNKIFAADKNIRYVGIIGPGPKYNLLESHMREGVRSVTPERTDKEFAEIIPPIMLGAAERLEKDAGSIIYSVIRYQKVTLMFFKLPKYTVMLSVEPGIYLMPIYKSIQTLLGISD